LPNQVAEFVWDGLDYLGRPVMGSATAHVSVGFEYDAVYYGAGDFAQSFGQAGSDLTGIRARQEVISWKHVVLEMVGGRSEIAEGWTLSAHHHVSLTDHSTLHKGNGSLVKNNVNIIETVAGNGTGGYSGDESPATDAQLDFPLGVAVDASGNLYIVEWINNCIRKVDASGIITTVAGNGTSGYRGDGGPATNAQLDCVHGVAVDASGNIYITDTGNYRVRKVDPSGVITTVAGNGAWGYSGDEGPATNAQLDWPLGMAVDALSNIYITDGYRIRKVDTNGIITTVAGGTWGYSGDGGPAGKAKLNWPLGVAVDAVGNLYIADTYNYCIRKVDTNGIITTVAGLGTTQGYSGDGRTVSSPPWLALALLKVTAATEGLLPSRFSLFQLGLL